MNISVTCKILPRLVTIDNLVYNINNAIIKDRILNVNDEIQTSAYNTL